MGTDPVSQACEYSRYKDYGNKHRYEYTKCTSQPHRSQKRNLGNGKTGETDNDGYARKDNRAPRRSISDGNRFGTLITLRQLLTVSGDNKKRVVYSDRQTEHGSKCQ
ncbi:hypothetical protein D3C75_894940 [compost metagenome]